MPSTCPTRTRSCTSAIKKPARIMITLSQREKEFLETLDNKNIEKIVNLFSKNTSEEDETPLRMAVLTSSLPEEVKMNYFKSLPFNDSNKYISLVKYSLQIPFNKFLSPPNTKSKIFLDNAKKTMDSYITGNDESKNEVLKLLCQWKNGSFETSYAIGLEGKPGTGKTTFAKHAFSEATNLPLVFVGLGGVEDQTYLLGSSYSYEGSTYGRLVSGLIESKCSNPIFFFDELDKIPSTPKGEQIISTLIHLIDPVQNSSIRDKYFPFDIDFSKCVFIFSYNDPTRISPILLDRIKRIKLKTPTTEEEQVIIMKNHIIPRVLLKLKLSSTFDDDVLKFLYTRNKESTGMRSIEKDIEHILACANVSKSYGSLSILGIDKSYKLKNKITLDFVKDVLKKEEKKQDFASMMYS